MRVLQANKYHYAKGGAERYYLDLSRKLAERGHTVVPFAMKHPRNDPTPYERFFVRGVDYRNGLPLRAKLAEALRTVYNRETVRQVEALAAEAQPQVAHLHNIYHQLSPSLVSALDRLGVPMVHSLHDYKIVCPGVLFMVDGSVCERCKGGRYHHALVHKCLLSSRAASAVGVIEAVVHGFLKTYGKVSRFLCPSRFLLEKVAEFGVPREKLIHFPYFLPLEDYRPQFAESDYFIYLGRLSREKGIGTLFEALRRRHGDRLACRVLGEGPEEDTLRSRLRAGDLRGVELTGYLQGEALHAAIRGAAFTVVPSEWYENLPFSVLESFALGTPVVGSQMGGIPEMVLDGQTGWTFPAGDAQALADRLDWMEDHRQRMVVMGRNARTLIEERYAPGPHLQRLEALYAEVMAEAGGTRVAQEARGAAREVAPEAPRDDRDGRDGA